MMKFIKNVSEIMKQNDAFYEKWFNDNEFERLDPDDCAVEALRILCNISWYEAYNALSDRGRDMFMIMNHVKVVDSVFRDYGYKYVEIEGEKITVAQFADNHPKGRYVVYCDGHVAAVIDGALYDYKNNGRRRVYGYYEKIKTVLDREA